MEGRENAPDFHGVAEMVWWRLKQCKTGENPDFLSYLLSLMGKKGSFWPAINMTSPWRLLDVVCMLILS